MMGLDNPLHLAFLLLLVLLVFGAKRLPEMGRSLGAGMRGFRESITGETRPSPHVSELSEREEPISFAAAARPAGDGAPAKPVAAADAARLP
jgi:sec-independent protein translocase protein TatA